MKIAVVGASGEIGSRLTQHLVMLNQNPRAISRRRSPRLARWGSLDFVQADMGDERSLTGALEGCQVVINCIVDKSSSITDRDRVRSNIQGCKNLLEASIKSRVHRFIHLSSIVVLPPNITQDILARPFEYSKEQDWYTKAKIETERIALDFQKKLSICIVRPGIVYGAYISWSRVAFSRCTTSTVALPESKPSNCYAVHVDDLVGLLIHLSQPYIGNTGMLYAVNPEHVSWHDFYLGHADGIGLDRNRVVLVPASILESKVSANRPGRLKELLAWLYATPLLPPKMRSSWWLQRMVRLINRDAHHNVQGDMLSSHDLLWPSKPELDMYSSSGIFCEEDVGETLGYSYQIPFAVGCTNAADWWNYRIPGVALGSSRIGNGL